MARWQSKSKQRGARGAKSKRRRTAQDGTVYDSVAEKERYEYLCDEVARRGDMRSLATQVPLELEIGETTFGTYRIDFYYEMLGYNGHWFGIWEEHKGGHWDSASAVRFRALLASLRELPEKTLLPPVVIVSYKRGWMWETYEMAIKGQATTYFRGFPFARFGKGWHPGGNECSKVEGWQRFSFSKIPWHGKNQRNKMLVNKQKGNKK